VFVSVIRLSVAVVAQELHTLPEHMSLVFSGVRVIQFSFSLLFFEIIDCSFVPFLLVIALSVFL
jgi:hypothetical protein